MPRMTDLPWERNTIVVARAPGSEDLGAGEAERFADLQARAANPRPILDSKENLAREAMATLPPETLAKLASRFPLGFNSVLQRPGTALPPQLKVEHVGERLVTIDPMTGTPRVIYEPADQTAQKLSEVQYKDLLGRRRVLLGKQFLLNSDKENLADIEKQIAAHEASQVRPPPMLPTLQSPANRGFIGAPTGESSTGLATGATNHFSPNPFQMGFQMGSAGAAASARKTLTREQATGFLQQAGGDKAKARRMAADAGYDF